MEINIEFEYGPLFVEVEGDDGDDISEVLDTVAEFLEEHEEDFFMAEDHWKDAGQFNSRTVSNGGTKSPEQPNAVQSAEVPDTSQDMGWGKLADETDVAKEKLRHMFGIDDELPPQILFGDSLSDESKTEQMLQGTLMILAVWEDYHGGDSLKKVSITDALERSGLHAENYYNLYQRGEFNRLFIREEVSSDSGGETSEISLTPPGKTEAYNYIQEYSEYIDI